MIGAIIGDIIGSVYEAAPIKTEHFPLFSENSVFTDDTVLTIATADALLNDGNYGMHYRKWGRKYPNAGFGAGFYTWLFDEGATTGQSEEIPPPYNSWGNGGAMRVSPVSFAFKTLREVEIEAEKSAKVTHSHPEGIKGAKAVAATVSLVNQGTSLDHIQNYLEVRFGYDLGKSLEEVRIEHSFDVSAAGSVPPALIAFFASENFTDAIRKAVSLGGDADTQAAIAGAIAHAHYKEIPENISCSWKAYLPDEMLEVIDRFCEQFKIDF